MPASSGRSLGASAAIAPNAPSTWNHRPCSRCEIRHRAEIVDRADIHRSGGADQQERTLAARPVCRDASRPARQARIRPWSSQAIIRSASWPSPAISIARGKHPCAAAEV